MIQDPQEYLDKWEREHNPFYPSEMRWDRVKVNRFLKDWKEQCNIANIVGRSEQLRAFSKWYEENYQFEISDRAIQEYERYGS